MVFFWRIENQRRLAGTGYTVNYSQLIVRKHERNVLRVVDARHR